MRRYKKFTKDQRGSFRYWFWHWLAFNDTAREYGVWRFRHLFHDIDKPFLKIFLPYEKVQKIHRTHHAHHLEYKGKRNWIDMFIDWECSSRTKYACPRNGEDEANWMLYNGKMSKYEYQMFLAAAHGIISELPDS